MNTWNQIREKLLPPPDAKWLSWLFVPLSSLFFSTYLALSNWTEFHKEAIFFALTLEIFLVLFHKKALFLLGLLAYVVGMTCLLLVEPKTNLIWNSGWLLTVFLSLFLCYQIHFEVSEIFESSAIKEKDLKRDADLWKSRFETLHEKIVSDKEVVDLEIEKMQAALLEKEKEKDSLRLLIGISHKETRRLEEMEIKHEETLKLLEKAHDDLKMQQEALRQRQTINESLQAKKTSKQPISLKDLSIKG